MHQIQECPYFDRPCAVEGLTSYRYQGKFGWVMIGAKNTADALRESLRSSQIGGEIDRLQVWKDGRYVPVMSSR